MILDYVSPKIRRELKLQDTSQNPEMILQLLENIQGDENRLIKLMMKFFTVTRGEVE